MDATRPPDAAGLPDHRRARRRSAPPPRQTAHHGPAHTYTATSSEPPAATTPPASSPLRCPAHPPALAWPRRSGPATDHPAGYDARARPVLVSPEPLLMTTAVMLAVSAIGPAVGATRMMIILGFLCCISRAR